MDIDKFFREQFLEHEKNSASYSPDQWKNFEQLLDRKTRKRKNTLFGFSFNSLFFFMSSFVIVMLIPLLFLHSDNVKEPDLNHEKNIIVEKNRPLDPDDYTPAETNNTEFTENIYSCNSVETKGSEYISRAENAVAENAAESEIKNIELTTEEKSSVKLNKELNAFIPVKITVIKDTSVFVFSSVNSIKTKKESRQTDTAFTAKKGKIKRSKILLPHFYYNGF